MHIDSDDKDKLDLKSKKCYFSGYDSDEFEYRFWNDQNRKIIRQKDVIFNEKVLYKDKAVTKSENAEKPKERVSRLRWRKSQRKM